MKSFSTVLTLVSALALVPSGLCKGDGDGDADGQGFGAFAASPFRAGGFGARPLGLGVAGVASPLVPGAGFIDDDGPLLAGAAVPAFGAAVPAVPAVPAVAAAVPAVTNSFFSLGGAAPVVSSFGAALPAVGAVPAVSAAVPAFGAVPAAVGAVGAFSAVPAVPAVSAIPAVGAVHAAVPAVGPVHHHHHLPAAVGVAPGLSYEDVFDEPLPHQYGYDVADPLTGQSFGANEESDGVGNTRGEYRVALPDGRIQVVRYSVNGPSGYVADVSYEGVAAPVAPAYGPAIKPVVPVGPAYGPAYAKPY